MKKKKKIDFIKIEDDLRNNIIKHRDSVGIPGNFNFRQCESHSWIETKYKPINEVPLITRLTAPPIEDVIKCKKVIIKFNNDQKKIVFGWLDGEIKMYNYVVALFKDYIYKKIPLTGQIVSFWFIRDVTLKDVKSALCQQYGIPPHVLDKSIKRACTMLKSCKTNHARGNIRNYRLNYIKQTVETKIIVIEKQYFCINNNSFYSSYLGDYIESYGFKLNEVDADCTLHYDVGKKVFMLLVPIKFKSDADADIVINKKTLVIDAGVRTFITGISEDHLLELGNNLKKTLTPLFNEIDAINNSDMPARVKKKKTTILYNRIKNLVTDMHWKAINYLVKTYGIIVVGDWRTQSCCSNKNTKIDAMTKRIMNKLSFYKPLPKLTYKYEVHRVSLYIIPEHFTSQMCSNCGAKNNVGGSKTYDCENCMFKIDRDVNSCRNLYMSWKN